MSRTHDELHRIVTEVCAEEGWPVPTRDGNRTAVERAADNGRGRFVAATDPERRQYALNDEDIGWDDPEFGTPAGLAFRVRSHLRGIDRSLDPTYSDEWADEDLQDLTRATLLRFDQEHPEDEGYGDIAAR
ncbi:MAG: hypothetical protein K2X82_01385 [Gemmataceae bacterium]|nr:hypothetical protein [Gemmataceae bacterium]